MKKIVGIAILFLLPFICSTGSSHAADKRTNKLYELYNSTPTPANQKPRLKHFIDRRERIEKIRDAKRAGKPTSKAIEATSIDAPAVDSTFKLGKVYAYPYPAVGVKHPVIHIEAGLADKVEIKVYDNTGKLVEEALLTDPPKIIRGVYAYEYKFASENTPSGACSFTVRAFKSGFDPIETSGKMIFINMGFQR
ncbi:MAG: hypothetical protein PHV36_14880 [Elusimicrobiales bacterium]|nr:hypothetical protein [Elusimicrobiales bacterium]